MVRELAKSFFFYGLAAGISRSLLILLVPLYTSIFSPEEYGIIDLLTGLVALLVLVGMLQMESAIARYYYESSAEERTTLIATAFKTIAIFSLLFAVVLFGFASLLSERFLQVGGHGALIRISCLLIPLSILFNFLVFLIRYEQKPLVYFGFIISQVSCTLLAMAYFVYLRSDYFGLSGVIWGQVVGVVIPLVGLLYYFRVQIAGPWSNAVLEKLLRYAVPLIPSTAINWANAYFSRFFMLQYFALAEIGVYSVAARIASMFSLIEVAFSLAWGPFFWSNYMDKEKHPVFFAVFKHASVFIFSIVAVATLLSDELIMLFATEAYLASARVLGIVFLANSLTIFIHFVGQGAAIRRKTHYSLFITTIGLGINILLILVLQGRYGISGVATASLAGNIITLVLFWTVSNRLYHLGYPATYFWLCGGSALVVVMAMTNLLLPASLRWGMAGFLGLLAAIYGAIHTRRLLKT